MVNEEPLPAPDQRDPEAGVPPAGFGVTGAFFERASAADRLVAVSFAEGNAAVTEGGFGVMKGTQADEWASAALRVRADEGGTPPAAEEQAPAGEPAERFTGRQWLLDEIRNWLLSGERRELLLQADAGIGKSALLSECLRRDGGASVVAWHFCQHELQLTLQPGAFVRDIAAQLRQSLPAYGQVLEGDAALQHLLAEEADTDPAGTLEAGVLAPLRRLPPPGGTRLLLIDALDAALELAAGPSGRRLTIVDLLVGLGGRLPPWLRIVATTRPLPLLRPQLHEAFHVFELQTQDARQAADLKAYALAESRRPVIAQRRIEAAIPEETFAQAVVSHSGGSFRYITHVLRDLAAGSLAIDSPESLPEGMDGLYQRSLERRFGSEAARYAPARGLLSVMCAACEPISCRDLAEVLGVAEAAVRDIQKQLPDLLSSSGELLGLDRPAWEWLTQETQGQPRAGRFAVSVPDGSRLLRLWALARVKAGTAHASPYLLRHLAGHLLNDPERQWAYARLLCEQFQWSQARLAESGVAGLLEDIGLIRGHPEQALLEALVRSSQGTLRRSVRHWCAQVIGRLGSGEANRGLPALVASAAGWVAAARSPEALVPRTRSLRLVTAQEQVLEGGGGDISALLRLDDGRLVAGGLDGVLRVWDVARGQVLRVLKGHTARVRALAMLPDGRMASGADDGTVRVWDLARAGAPQILEGHTRAVLSLAVLPQGRLAAGGADRMLRVWDLKRGGAPRVLEGHTGPVRALTALPDGRLVSGSDDETLRVWDLTKAKSSPRVLDGHCGRICALTVLHDGQVASGADDYTMRLWNLAVSGPPRVIEEDAEWIAALAQLPDGRLISGGFDGTVRVWDLARGGRPRVLAGHSRAVQALAVLEDGSLVTGGEDDTLRLWNLSHEGAPRLIGEHTGAVRAIAALPDGRLVSGCDDGTLRVWSPGRSGVPQVLDGPAEGISALAVLTDGRVVSGGYDGTVRVWDLQRQEPPRVLDGDSDWVRSLARLPDGRIVCGSEDGTLRIWNVASGNPAQILEGPAEGTRALAVLRDGRVVSGAGDGTLRVWDPRGGAPRLLAGEAGSIEALAVLPDGRVISSTADETLRVWDLAGDGAPTVLKEGTGWVWALAVLPDGRLVSGADDCTLRVWDPVLDTCQSFIADAPILSLAVTADGLIAAGCQDGAVHFMKPPGGGQPSRSRPGAAGRSLLGRLFKGVTGARGR